MEIALSQGILKGFGMCSQALSGEQPGRDKTTCDLHMPRPFLFLERMAMSVEASSWAWKQLKGLPDKSSFIANRKLLLLAIADHADDQGWCWPSKKRLSEKTGFKKTGLQAMLKWLEQNQLIERKPHFEGGRQTSNWIHLPVVGGGVVVATPRGRRSDPPRGRGGDPH